ncbi:MAG: UDP-N-acetylmuramoyl-tripeptide--D-alanyl-D-alanine ligase [Candidatus Atribacteria bacterium]|uniref:UDP-N-acetylmuramoyl-tripeptide--D-alanyl-D- alanine ligase n=1 Tax=Atrimonas thermophila TaxID=3064161 RepID=UPI0024ABC104|nr:UDP-N-acetylmuramoyl-tripeptide--D-alanyl-D-alanine ligase [Candidatus Atribacteria bacterium]
MKISVEEVATAFQVEPAQRGVNGFFEGIAIDSRECRANQLFFALPGQKSDGHYFVKEALDKGASGLVVHKNLSSTVQKEVYVFKVKDTVQALKKLAERIIIKYPKTRIALTGTVGKTSCKNFLYQILGKNLNVEITPKSYNTLIGVSWSACNFREASDLWIFEAGISQKGEMAELSQVIKPEIVIFTALGRGHLEGLRNEEEVAHEKAQLMGEYTKLVYLNTDNAWWPIIKQEALKHKIPVITFGQNPESRLRIAHIELKLDSMKSCFRLLWGDEKIANYQTPLLFPELISLLAPVIDIATRLGVPQDTIYEGIAQLTLPTGRGNWFRYNQGIIFNDAYNANPLSYRKMLNLLTRFSSLQMETWLVAGDMLELGSYSLEEHLKLLKSIAESPINKAILLGTQMHQAYWELTKQSFSKKEKFQLAHSHQEIREILVENLSFRKDKWVVAFKASRQIEIEKAIPEEWRQNECIRP